MTLRNRDSSGLRNVAKGLTVSKDGHAGRVVKLRNGHALVLWGDAVVPSPEWCKDLKIVKGVARQSAQLLLF